MVGGRGRRLGDEPCRALPRDAAVALRDRVRRRPPRASGSRSAASLQASRSGSQLRLTGAGSTRPSAIAALYVLSLGILDLAERTFGGSIETDFERGHVAVSVLWTLIGLGLLIAGLIRDSRLLRYGGLTLFGLSLAKIFLYDLSALNSVARALSFIVVGALVLVGGFFLQRLSAQRRPPAV